MPILTELKEELQITNTSFDDELGRIINSVLANADTEMKVKYSAVTGNVQYWDGGVKTLYFDYVNISNLVLTDDDDVLVEGRDEDFVLYSGRGYMKSTSDAFTSGLKIIAATYDGGYDEDDLPTDLREQLKNQMKFEFRRRKDLGLSNVTYPDGSVNKFVVDNWLPSVQRVLNSKRRIYL